MEGWTDPKDVTNDRDYVEILEIWEACLEAAVHHGIFIPPQFRKLVDLSKRKLLRGETHDEAQAEKLASWFTCHSASLDITHSNWKVRVDVFIIKDHNGRHRKEIFLINGSELVELVSNDVESFGGQLIDAYSKNGRKLFDSNGPPSLSQAPRSNAKKMFDRADRKRRRIIEEESSEDSEMHDYSGDDSEYGNSDLKPENLMETPEPLFSDDIHQDHEQAYAVPRDADQAFRELKEARQKIRMLEAEKDTMETEQKSLKTVNEMLSGNIRELEKRLYEADSKRCTH
ncbi:uncharacterized protein K452DRAFT_302488 [Aplosporella prunicola CBS 121167]|uniref:Uncharacterized protein n=1 Tax=Aplosporella prunicola CBS 121167 TaxID=1176127 RepID=A0A6A6AXY4_9PEZI|nr:uncharacterized protein K452DRAFT_302488 [Aplosporella prunicola CBS 121167]KAF2136799.1 hypothetical protein K452DRAFT_302488 [Aplosporella prunicola CBS 121167]